MKVLLIVAFAISASSADLSREFVAEKWESFKATHNRNYLNAKEEAFRQQIFQDKLKRFEAHNERYDQGLETYTVGVNQFTDMTEEEMRPYLYGVKMPEVLPIPDKVIKSREDLGIPQDYKRPNSWDWRDYGVVTPVKDQGGCGSCWAFSATGAIEAQEKIAFGSGLKISTSEQQLVDCVTAAGGCGGGWMNDAFQYVMYNKGIDSDTAYPYEARDGNCRYRSDKVVARLSGYTYLTKADEELLADMVHEKGPVAVAFNSEGGFQDYNGGVYYNPNCDPYNFTHAVLIVGYGTENGQDYWLVKNSWGAGWALGGYIKMARNRGNMCGIASVASIPNLQI